MDLNDTGGAVLMGDMTANTHALGPTYGFSVMPDDPLPLAVRWFINGVVSGFTGRGIEQVLTSPLGCAWMFTSDTPQDHRIGSSVDIRAELDRRLQDVTQLDRRFVHTSSDIVPVPVQLRPNASGFTLELGGIVMGSPGLTERVKGVLSRLKQLRLCDNTKVRPDGLISLERTGAGIDQLLLQLSTGLSAFLGDYLCEPGDHPPVVALWPVPKLDAIFGIGASARLLHEVTAG